MRSMLFKIIFWLRCLNFLKHCHFPPNRCRTSFKHNMHVVFLQTLHDQCLWILCASHQKNRSLVNTNILDDLIQAPLLPFAFATSNFFTALVYGSVSMCIRERLLRRSTHGSCVLFFMFKTNRRATKVKETQTPLLAPIVTVSPQR
jgi:hypothetical protein